MHNKENINTDLVDGEITNRMSFAELSKQKMLNEQSSIQLVYMQNENSTPSKSSFLNKNSNNASNGEKKTTTFATLPNTTTWQQQSSMSSTSQNLENNMSEDVNAANNVMPSQLNDIRLKLEEKRRNIESEKRKMEMVLNKMRQNVGKAAFLQAVVKVSYYLILGFMLWYLDLFWLGDFNFFTVLIMLLWFIWLRSCKFCIYLV